MFGHGFQPSHPASAQVKSVLSTGILAALLMLCASAAFSQGDRGTVTGLVADSSGSAITGAEITIVNAVNNLTMKTVSNESGNYRLIGVPIGVYELNVTSPGFQGYRRTEVQIQTNQTTNIDIQLSIGAVTEIVTVTGASIPLISTETMEVGMVVESKRFLDLPLTMSGQMRTPSRFMKLSPGVAPSGTWTRSISGGGGFQDQTYYDGIALSRGDQSQDDEVTPSVEAIQEFKLITNNYSAEYAHAMGGITSYTMKSGTNELHGQGLYLLRNEKLDARSFFAASRLPSKMNEWGGVIGGPVVIPKVYDGRNKTFWFVSFDQFYFRGGQVTSLLTLPTTRMQRGDFIELPHQIYDPAATARNPDGTVTRTPFANNFIPENRRSRVSTAILKYHPQPTLLGIQANAVPAPAEPIQDNRHAGGKADHIFNAKHRISFLYNFTDRPAQKSGSFPLPVNDDTRTALVNYTYQRVRTKVMHANVDSTISPSTMNHIGIGYSMFRNPFGTVARDLGWADRLGLKGVQFDLFPAISFATDGYASYGQSAASESFFNTFTVLDTLTTVRGKHTLKFGVEMQYHQDNFRPGDNGAGNYTFRRNETGDPARLNTTGDAFASFLLGEVDSGQAFFLATHPSGRYSNWGLFIDDTWKLTSRLTLNLGLRWEIIAPHADPAGRLSYVDINRPNAAAGNMPGVLVFGGDQGFGNRLLNMMWANPAPRFGFAYKLTDKTVVRGGAGVFYSDFINRGLLNRGLPNTGFSTTATFATGDNGITPAFNWDNGFPQNFVLPPNTNPFQLNGQNATVVLPGDYTLPRKLQWNFTVERQVGDDIGVSAGYVANVGRHLYATQQINQLPRSAQSLPESLLRSHIDSAQAQAAGIRAPFAGFAQLWGTRGTVAQALRPYPQYGDTEIYGSTYGNSNYHSFQLKVDKRYRGGLTGTLAYTWSKFLTNAPMYDSYPGRQDHYLREQSYHPSHLPHMLTASTLYNLPFGRGKRFGSGLKGFANVLAGGWQVAAVMSYTSGRPLNVTTNNTLPYFNAGRRPNLVSDNIRSDMDMSDFDPGRDVYLNRAAFADPAPGQFGNAPRYLNVRGPLWLDESFSVFKDTMIGERVRNQFRMEITNPLNRAVFGNPNTNLTAGANFGRITSVLSPRVIQFGMKLFF
jgi:hypothetical protein